MAEALFDPLVWLILLPILWGVLAFLPGPGRGATLALVGLTLQLGCAVRLTLDIMARGPLTHPAGGWPPPLGITLTADGLAAAMLVLTQAVGLAVALYARSSFRNSGSLWFWPLTGFLFAGMNGLFLSGDLFNLYVTLELIGLAAVGLVANNGKREQTEAALRYLMASLVGSGAYLFGVALVYGVCGTVALDLVAEQVAAPAPPALWLAFALMGAGLLLKTALFPLHFWLPPAHGGAPAPVSALLSALVVKASFYLFLRLWLGPFAGLVAAVPALALLPALAGGAAVLYGSWMAIRAERLKMLIAYSTVAQLGYLFLIFPVFGQGALALQAGLLQATAHGTAKAAMFIAAGTLLRVGDTDTVQGMAGAANQLPVTLFAFALAGVSLMGLPPSGGFLAKWLLIDAALAAGQLWIAVVAVAGGLLASVYVFRVLRLAFRVPDGRDEPGPRPVPAALEWTALLLAVASVGLGLFAMPLFALLEGVGP
jgi:formate hydrogenlyase subunit 3/multisubunit Na+/H+ antiporter MnhD subunit